MRIMRLFLYLMHLSLFKYGKFFSQTALHGKFLSSTGILLATLVSHSQFHFVMSVLLSGRATKDLDLNLICRVI